MKTKIFLSLIVVILVSLIVSGTALAGAEALNSEAFTGVRSRLKYGEVTEIGSENFSIEILDGGIYTYLVDGNTRFRMWDDDEPGFSDLELGDYVIVASKIEIAEVIASVVAITPEDFNPSMWFGIRVRGEVLDVDIDSGMLTVLKITGEEIDFNIGSRTRFLGAASSLEELEVGWFVYVTAGEQADGSYKATVLASSENPHRVRNSGLVTAVDLDSSTVSISTRIGDEVRFYVDTNTKFYSRGKKIKGLSDLDVDMVSVVIARYRTDGTLLAIQIAATRTEDIPNYEVKAGGRITEISVDYFTILSQSGEEVTFNVDSETSFRGRGVEVQRVDDLEIGMIALAGGDQSENGATTAKLIIIIQFSTEE